MDRKVPNLILLYTAALAGTVVFNGLIRTTPVIKIVAAQLWFVVLAWSAARINRGQFTVKQQLAWQPIRLRTAVYVALFALFMIPVIQLFGLLIAKMIPGFDQYLQVMNSMLQQNRDTAGTVGLMVLFVVLPAFCEELLFRGVILQTLLKSGANVAVSVVTVGILFGLFHLDPFRLVPIALLGIMMGAVTAVTGTIWAAVIYHFINNVMVIIGFLTAGQDGQAISVEISLTEIGLSIAGLCLGLLIWKRIKLSVVSSESDQSGG